MPICKKCNKESTEIEKLSKCGHNICYQCLYQHLDKLTSAQVTCPVTGCAKMIQDAIIRKFLSNTKLIQYDQLCLGSNTVKCLVPDCIYYVAYEEKTGVFNCPMCNQPNCLSCGQLHNENESCQSITKGHSKKFENAAYSSLQTQRKNALFTDSDLCDLIPNSELVECPICYLFILPRSGVSLRNCMDTFCRPCLDAHAGTIDSIRNMSCPNADCSLPFTERECQTLVGPVKLRELCLDFVKPRMFNCQTPECKGMWDFASYTGKYTCPLCKSINCAACQDIHEGKTCAEFQQTSRFKDALEFRNKLAQRTQIVCQNCRMSIIKKGGCNALRCPNCRLQVCAYSGLEVGPKGCNCTNSKRCAVGCQPGCIPEGDSAYEKTLAAYFWKN